MVSLVFHALDPDSRTLSPFVQHILSIADGSRDLRIACPYIGLAVLRPVLATAKSWRLLTDAEELLKGKHASQRPEWVRFLAEYREQVRHCRWLHAKVVAGDAAALVGSANLTKRGMGGRQEVGVLVDEPTLVGELHAWFDGLWERCELPSRTTLESFVSALPEGLLDTNSPQLPNKAPQVQARVFAHTTAEEAPETTGEESLLERLARSVSREWINAFLDMCADLLGALGTTSEDPRLATTLPKTERGVLRVNLNRREVLSAHSHDRMAVGLILPRAVKVPPNLSRRIVYEYEFKPASDEKWFAYFSVEDPRLLAPLRGSWLSAIADEAARQQERSNYRHHHVPAFFGCVTDVSYRRRLLDTAFPSKCWRFGVNNSSGGHMQLRQCRAFLDSPDATLGWPAGNSKPKKLYAEMRQGDRVLLWTGHGKDPGWGLIGTARIREAGPAGVVLANPEPFRRPFTPYPRGQPSETEEVSFLLTAFGDGFDALGDVRRAVGGTQRRPPVTVAAIPSGVFDMVVARARASE